MHLAGVNLRKKEERRDNIITPHGNEGETEQAGGAGGGDGKEGILSPNLQIVATWKGKQPLPVR